MSVSTRRLCPVQASGVAYAAWETNAPGRTARCGCRRATGTRPSRPTPRPRPCRPAEGCSAAALSLSSTAKLRRSAVRAWLRGRNATALATAVRPSCLQPWRALSCLLCNRQSCLYPGYASPDCRKIISTHSICLSLAALTSRPQCMGGSGKVRPEGDRRATYCRIQGAQDLTRNKSRKEPAPKSATSPPQHPLRIARCVTASHCITRSQQHNSVLCCHHAGRHQSNRAPPYPPHRDALSPQ